MTIRCDVFLQALYINAPKLVFGPGLDASSDPVVGWGWGHPSPYPYRYR